MDAGKIVERERVAFGSTIVREVLPRKGPSLTGFMMLSGATKGSGPDTYYYKDVNNSFGRGQCKTVSIGRSARWPADKSYQPPLRPLEPPRRAQTARAPFNVSTPQRPEVGSNKNPGPGTYNPSSMKRHMRFHHSFGGRRILIPAVEIKCVPYNDDVCAICDERCIDQGDYWHQDNATFLCRPCFEKQYRTHTRYNTVQLNGFKLIRDCSFAHHHERLKYSIKLMSFRQIRKKVYKEAYLEQFFPSIG